MFFCTEGHSNKPPFCLTSWLRQKANIGLARGRKATFNKAQLGFLICLFSFREKADNPNRQMCAGANIDCHVCCHLFASNESQVWESSRLFGPKENCLTQPL